MGQSDNGACSTQRNAMVFQRKPVYSSLALSLFGTCSAPRWLAVGIVVAMQSKSNWKRDSESL